ncbi:MAG: N-acetylneuraminate synthase family protein, partial [Thermodesulfobacteriota bacterium]|nr:N-acetylneuraminate synthase family protein [Thermodesulfobacteriota bacterium]
MSYCKIIAEIGSNHNGELSLAKEMIWAAKYAGADIVKFQSWQAKNLKPKDPNFERHIKAELSDDAHFILKKECKKAGVKFLTTCFDIGRIDFLKSLGLDTVKVASPDLGSIKMIKTLREKFPHLIISTGMSYKEEIYQTARILKDYNYTFLHCTSLYPTPIHKVNLIRMDWLKGFAPHVGFSDHTMGCEAAKAAIARGAEYIEKHFTLSRNLPGKDQKISAIPEEIKEIADYAKNIQELLGSCQIELCEEEMELRKIYIGKWGDN